MELSLSIVVFLNILFSVSCHYEFVPPNEAMNNSLYEDALDEELCAEQINIIRSNVLLTMYFADAGIRIPKGILIGNTLDLGNYHQCIEFNILLQDSELQGKYCAIRVPIDQTWQLPELPGLPQVKDNSNFDPRSIPLDNETISNLQEYYIISKGMKSYTGIYNDDRMPGGNPLSGLELTLGVCIPKPCTTRQAFDSYLV